MIVRDDVPMAPETLLKTVNALVREIMQRTAPSSRKIMVLGGDSGRILPIVEKGSRVDIVNICLYCTYAAESTLQRR